MSQRKKRFLHKQRTSLLISRSIHWASFLHFKEQRVSTRMKTLWNTKQLLSRYIYNDECMLSADQRTCQNIRQHNRFSSTILHIRISTKLRFVNPDVHLRIEHRSITITSCFQKVLCLAGSLWSIHLHAPTSHTFIPHNARQAPSDMHIFPDSHYSARMVSRDAHAKIMRAL